MRPCNESPICSYMRILFHSEFGVFELQESPSSPFVVTHGFRHAAFKTIEARVDALHVGYDLAVSHGGFSRINLQLRHFKLILLRINVHGHTQFIRRVWSLSHKPRDPKREQLAVQVARRVRGRL